MLEPSKPVTLKIRYTPYPAVQLQSDDGRVLRPGSAILRHRYLKQQFSIVASTSRQRPRALIAIPAGGLPTSIPAVAAASGPSSAGPAAANPPAAGPPAANPPAGPAAANPPAAGPAAANPSAAGPPAANPSAARPPAANPPAANPPAANLSATGPPAAGPSAAGSSTADPSVALLVVNSPVSIATTETSVTALVGIAQRSPSRSHEIVDTSDSNLVVRRGQHAIRDKKGKTVWFYSDGLTYLLEPPSIERAKLGDLYVHTTANCDQQIWLFNRNSAWEKIQLYHPHPTLGGYVFHLLNNGEPRWVQKTTVTTYRGRDKRFQQIVSRSEGEAAPTSSGMASRLADAP